MHTIAATVTAAAVVSSGLACSANAQPADERVPRAPDIIECKIKSGALWSQTYFYRGAMDLGESGRAEQTRYFRLAPAYKDGEAFPVLIVLSGDNRQIENTVPIADPELPQIDFGNCKKWTELATIIGEGRAFYFPRP